MKKMTKIECNQNNSSQKFDELGMLKKIKKIIKDNMTLIKSNFISDQLIQIKKS